MFRSFTKFLSKVIKMKTIAFIHLLTAFKKIYKVSYHSFFKIVKLKGQKMQYITTPRI